MQIIAASNSVIGVGAHEFFILMDDAGNFVGQINGFAVGSDNIPKVTNITGQLQVRTDYGVVIDSDTKMKPVAIGPQDSIMKIWNTGKACGDAINQKQYSYNLLDSFGGHNSNAAFSTIATCMKVSDVDLNGPFTAVPGLHDIILDANTIAAIQQQHGMTPSTGSTGGSGSTGTGGGGEHSGNPGGVPSGSLPSGTYPIAGSGSGGGGGGHWQYPVAPHSLPASPYDTTVVSQEMITTAVGVHNYFYL